MTHPTADTGTLPIILQTNEKSKMCAQKKYLIKYLVTDITL